jgi:hypothetical protein
MVLPEASLIMLGFAGRFELPPLLNGKMDIAFWAAVGLILAVSLSLLSTKRKGWSISWLHPIVVAHLSLFMIVGIYWLANPTSEYGTEKTFRVLIYGPLLLILPQIVLSTVHRTYRHLMLFVGFVGLLASVSIVASLAASGIAGLQRISPLGGGPITLARLTGFAAIACVALFVTDRHKKVAVLAAVFLTTTTFATGSRGPTLFLIFVLVLAVPLMFLNQSTRRASVRLLWLSICGGSVFIAFMAYAIQANLPFAQRYLLLISDDRGASINTRANFLDQAKQFSARSWYMGSGTGSWPDLMGLEDVVAYPHNILAEYLVEQGAIGAASFMLTTIVTLVTFTYLLSQRASRDEVALVVVGGLSYLYALLLAQSSGDIYDNRYLWYFAGLLLSCYSRHRLGKSNAGVVLPDHIGSARRTWRQTSNPLAGGVVVEKTPNA